jgi:hypothetical protein
MPANILQTENKGTTNSIFCGTSSLEEKYGPTVERPFGRSNPVSRAHRVLLMTDQILQISTFTCFLQAMLCTELLGPQKIELDVKTFGYILAAIVRHHSFIALNRERH